MAVKLSFLSFVAPIAVINAKYPGGWPKFVVDTGVDHVGGVCFDEHLVCISRMDSSEMEELYAFWEELGFAPIEERDGKQFWKDCCIIEAPFGRPTLPCDWIKIIDGGNSACLVN